MSSHVHIGLYDALREAGASEEKALAALATLPFPQHLATKEDLLKAIGEVKPTWRSSNSRSSPSARRFSPCSSSWFSTPNAHPKRRSFALRRFAPFPS